MATSKPDQLWQTEGPGLLFAALMLMAGTEIWLALPLLLWLALYIGVLTWIMPSMIPAQHNVQMAKSAW